MGPSSPGDGVPGPGSDWARSPREVGETYALLAEQMHRIAARPDRSVTELSAAEHYALGVRAAAHWSMGRIAIAPLTDEHLPVDLGSAVRVMAVAEDLMTDVGSPETVAALAAGIRAWLLWLVGIEERLVLRTL